MRLTDLAATKVAIARATAARAFIPNRDDAPYSVLNWWFKFQTACAKHGLAMYCLEFSELVFHCSLDQLPPHEMRPDHKGLIDLIAKDVARRGNYGLHCHGNLKYGVTSYVSDIRPKNSPFEWPGPVEHNPDFPKETREQVASRVRYLDALLEPVRLRGGPFPS